MKIRFITGSYAVPGEKGIQFLEADTVAGCVREIFSDRQANCPSFVLEHPSMKVLYAVSERAPEGSLYTFRIREDSLELVNELPVRGQDPCHISLDGRCRFLAVMNYSGGNLTVFKLDEEGIPVSCAEHIAHEGSGPVTSRQEKAHPHFSAYRDGKLYVCDLGCDRIFIYDEDIENGTLTRAGEIVFPKGAGPRHLLFPKGHEDLLYAVGELSSSVYVFSVTEEGAKPVQTLSCLPEGCTDQNLSAAIKQSGDGTALFISNRGYDSIAVFAVRGDGLLEKKECFRCKGRTPRDFLVSDGYLIAAYQDSDSLEVFRYDVDTFALSDTGISYGCVKPTCTALRRGPF